MHLMKPSSRNPYRLLTACVMLFGLAVASNSAQAWSRYGHETIGHLAERHLSPEAREAVDALLGDESLGSVAAWADQVRPERRDTAPYHYVSGPRGVLIPRHEDLHLPQGTVYTAILMYRDQLLDASLDRSTRIEALKFLVHFVGDVHQPLHTGFADDLGGNRFEVIYRNEPFNIHRYWDLNIIEPRLDTFNSKEYAAYLDDQFSQVEKDLWIAQDDPEPWVVESRRFLFAGLYPVPQQYEYESGKMRADPIPVMDDTYRSVWMPSAEVQIARAGLRLAGLLNAVFDR